MNIGIIVLKLRLADTRFGNTIGGASDLEATKQGTLRKEVAFVVPLGELVTDSSLDSGLRQHITEIFSIVVAVKNDSTQKDKLGFRAYDTIAEVRQEIFSGILGWQPPGAESVISYKGGQVIEANRAWLWYQFDFNVETEITEEDGVVGSDQIYLTIDNETIGVNDLQRLETIYTQYVLAPNRNIPISRKTEKGNLPVVSTLPIDMTTVVDTDDDPTLGGFSKWDYDNAFKRYTGG